MWPRSRRMYQSVLTPASTATSSRRSPGTRRRPPGGQPDLLRCELGASGGQELPNLAAVVHTTHRTRSRTKREGDVVPPITRPPGHAWAGVSLGHERRHGPLLVYDLNHAGQNGNTRPKGPTVNPTYDFSGRVAFVTGAGSGMGLATARAFAEAGAAVTLVDLNDDLLHYAEDELRDVGDRVLVARCDV